MWHVFLFVDTNTKPFYVSCYFFVKGYRYDIHYEQTAQVVEATFSDGTLASFAEVLVYAPGDRDVEFQNGRTDARGRFAFLPDRPGTWLVKVNAGMGHGFDMEIEVLPDQLVP